MIELAERNLPEEFAEKEKENKIEQFKKKAYRL